MEAIEKDLLHEKERNNYCRYYRVNKNDTAITEISANDFKLPKQAVALPGLLVNYTLSPEAIEFDQFVNLKQAMEKAKAGAQAYIEQMIAEGDGGLLKLMQYRYDHYEDLHINLIEANIMQVETDMANDKNFQWTPYRIAAVKRQD